MDNRRSEEANINTFTPQKKKKHTQPQSNGRRDRPKETAQKGETEEGRKKNRKQKAEG